MLGISGRHRLCPDLIVEADDGGHLQLSHQHGELWLLSSIVTSGASLPVTSTED